MSEQSEVEQLEIKAPPRPNFKDALRIAAINAKSAVNSAIGNKYLFSCQLVNISQTVQECIFYADTEELTSWIELVFGTTLNPVYSAQALANMKQIPPNPRDNILIIIVTSSDTDVFVGVSVPKSLDSKINTSTFLDKISNPHKYETKTIKDSKGSFEIIRFAHSEAFKERDAVLRNCFNELKRLNIYVEEEEDDIIYDF